jgi:hypothetical protein
MVPFQCRTVSAWSTSRISITSRSERWKTRRAVQIAGHDESDRDAHGRHLWTGRATISFQPPSPARPNRKAWGTDRRPPSELGSAERLSERTGSQAEAEVLHFQSGPVGTFRNNLKEPRHSGRVHGACEHEQTNQIRAKTHLPHTEIERFVSAQGTGNAGVMEREGHCDECLAHWSQISGTAIC